jgi:hypothetical protein
LDGDIFVRQDSPQWQKDEVFLRAEALYISSHHDNAPWVTDYDSDTVGILLIENGGIIGGAGFIKDVTKQNWHWAFAFIDPQHQRKGNLTNRIPEWRKLFGEFTSSRPWSEAIRALFEKIGWFPAGEESLERNAAEVRKLQLKELARIGRLSRRWIKKENQWIQLLKRNALAPSCRAEDHSMRELELSVR